jgi:hypothetical protein
MKDCRGLCNEERPNVYSLCLRHTDVDSGKAIVLHSGGARFECGPRTSAILIVDFNSYPHLVRPCEYTHNHSRYRPSKSVHNSSIIL